MAVISTLALRRCVLIFMLIVSLFHSVTAGDYTSCYDCDYMDHVCCNGECVLGSSCLFGRNCTSNSDCSSRESCCGNSCTDDQHCVGDLCKTNADCGRLGSCCRVSILMKDRKCRKNCTGGKCLSGSDCGRNEHCCSNKCSKSPCWSCETDSDCGSTSKRCCNGKCHDQDDDECVNTAAILFGAVGVIVFLCFIGKCFDCVFRHFMWPRYYNNSVSNTRDTSKTNPPPYPGKDPSSNKQSYPEYPPPQYEQQETIAPPPYQPETTRANETPPPYNAAPKGTSQGVCAHYPSYGAVVISSAQLLEEH